MRFEPTFGAKRRFILSLQGRLDAKNGVSLFFGQLRNGTQEIRGELAPDFFGQPANFVVERAVAELQIMVNHQVLDVAHFEWHADGDADRAHRENFDDALEADWAVRADALQG